MRIIILGAKGMLGRELVEQFADYNSLAWDIANLDITKRELVFRKIRSVKPAIIINAAAYTDVDCSEKETDLAMKVNGEAVGFLAKICRELDAILVQISTDYVFDGQKKEGYNENDKPNPINAYGRSKLLGEELLQRNWNKFYLIRTSWLFGKYGPKNFVEKIVSQAKFKEKLPFLKTLVYILAGKYNLKVINDHYGKPSYAADVAKRIREILNQRLPFGIYHCTNETKPGGITWFEFARKIVELIGSKIEVIPCQAKDFPQPAKRPKYAALNNTKLPKMRSWEEALEEYLRNL